jgi:NodT family efflux transporter outer membrane factor (OMF) lipoprotein
MHSIPDSVKAPVDVPGSFSGGLTPEIEINPTWWTDFGDAELNRIIEKVHLENLDLKQAQSRLTQAKAMARQAGSVLWPQVQVEGTFRKSQSSMFLGDDFPFGNGVLETTTTSTPVSVGAAYELDVWGRARSTANAADLNLKAGVLDLVAFEMTLTAQITELWFMLAEVKNQSVLLREQLEANRTMLELVELRYTRGLASALDIHQQKVQMQGLEAQLPLIAARVKLFEHQLSVHMGQAPGSFNSTKTVAFPILTPVDNAGMPSTMLRMRPDVRAAEYRVRAAHGQVAAAIADRFPRVSLAASYGIPGHEGRPLFESFVWNLVGNVVAPVFDGGRRSAEVDRQRAIVEERVHAYGKTILVALREVEDALVSAKSQDHHVAGLEQQLVTAKLSLEEAKRRYLGGLIDYLPVLSALQSVQQLERMMISAKRGQVSYRIQLYRALGGGALSSDSKDELSTQTLPEAAETLL